MTAGPPDLNVRCVMVPDAEPRYECIGGPWDGEFQPCPTGRLALVRAAEPLGYVEFDPEDGRARLAGAEPAVVGVYALHAQKTGPHVLRWSPRPCR